MITDRQNFRVALVPQLEDNYGYLLIGDGGEALTIDPAEPERVLEAARREGARLTAVLNTHHHHDHSGGNLGLREAIPGLRILGSARDGERIPGLTDPLENDQAFVAAGIRGRALPVACHTRAHLAFLFDGPVLFSGDTLFVAGCGRFFEGTADDMYRALYQVIGALAGDTLVYPGHEYTEKNLRFALTVEPDNQRVKEKLAEAIEKRRAGEPTVPSTLDDERAFNPFLRVNEAGVRASVKKARPEIDERDPVAVLGALRALKDRF
jgi:hydroxyacylglutathione hydrolase